MRTDLRCLTSVGAAEVFREWCGRAEKIRILSAWATDNCPMRDDLWSARHKIETLVVGLDFCSTSPTFLRQFQEKVRIGKANGGRTFHPKVYVFEKGESFTCIVGSSNLTGGGFGGNTELNLCVTGGTDDDFIRSILGFIGEQEAASKPISVPEIDVYEREFT